MSNKKGIIWAYWGHEPMDHLRRMGNNNESIFSLGECAAPWYKRIHNEEMVEKASKAGINTIYTHFFKGFGLEHEKEEMDNTCRLTQIAHKYNIKVLGYCQLGSLYYETAIEEIPDLRKMARINQDGSTATWGSAYYRWSPCFNSRLFIEYMKKVIEYGIKYIKLDGFHFDNSYNQACYCENCRKKFRDFLEKNIVNPREVLGIANFKNVEIPPYRQLSDIHDPLYMWWLKYRSELCAETHKELFTFVKTVSDDKAEVLHNPAFPRKGRYVNEIAFEPSLSREKCDFIFAENNYFIQVKEKEVVSQVQAFKFGQKFGYKVFDSSWPYDPNGRHRHPETYEEIMRFVCQSIIFGGLCGSQWIARSTKKGDLARIDIPGQLEILTDVFKYFSNNLELYNENTKAHNYVKLLYFPLNCMASPGIGLKTFSDVSEQLASAGIPFSIATEEDILRLGGDQVLVIPELMYITENLYKKIIETAKKGCKILVIGKFAVYNENCRELDTDKLIFELGKQNNVLIVSRKDNEKNEDIVNTNIKDNIENSSIIDIKNDWINILRQLTCKNTIIVDPDGMMVETSKDENNRLLIHILNPCNEKHFDDVHIHVTGVDMDGKYRYVKVYSPESTELKHFEIFNKNINIYLTGLKTMATIVLYG